MSETPNDDLAPLRGEIVALSRDLRAFREQTITAAYFYKALMGFGFAILGLMGLMVQFLLGNHVGITAAAVVDRLEAEGTVAIQVGAALDLSLEAQDGTLNAIARRLAAIEDKLPIDDSRNVPEDGGERIRPVARVAAETGSRDVAAAVADPDAVSATMPSNDFEAASLQDVIDVVDGAPVTRGDATLVPIDRVLGDPG